MHAATIKTPQPTERRHYRCLNVCTANTGNIPLFSFIQKSLSQYVYIMIQFFNKQKRDNLYQLGGKERGGRTKFLTPHEIKKIRLIN